ncbi:MAG: ATP-binding cassette domain-containing protein [Alphaproteobacteria bacterium]|nr:ATP-binding cassette domain-containing protein [Alphaproteobacteria bacterium]
MCARQDRHAGIRPTMSHPENAIEIRGLRKKYHGGKGFPPHEALKGIDLDVPRGSFFGLLGPNGAGKSTLINILAGLVNKTEGQVSVWGFDIDEAPRNARNSIGVVPQEISFDAFFTPREALELQAGLYGVRKADRRTDEILAAMHLSDKANAYSRALSGGMKRRLLVAKAMVHSPPILVLDEPTAGVDIELRQQLWEHIRALKSGGVTIMLTTHYLEEAEQLCDRIAIINQGEVVANETTGDLLQRIDERELVMRLDRPVEATPDGLRDFPIETEAGNRLTVHYSASKHRVDEVLGAVHDAGYSILDLTMRQADLEDVFMQLTSRK